MLLIFACIASVFFVLSAPSLQLAYNDKFKGTVSEFRDLAETGVSGHHFQTVDLYGWITFDNRMDISGESNHVLNRYVIIEDEATHYAALIKVNHMYDIRSARMDSVTGIIRRMSGSDYDDFNQFFGDQIDALRDEGWTIDPHYYINEYEELPNPDDIHGMLIFAGVNLGLILICLIPFVVPHPRTIKKESK